MLFRSLADVTIFDPKKKWTYDASQSRSKSRNTPYDGWSFTGKVIATIVAGQVVYSDQDWVAPRAASNEPAKHSELER